MIFNSIEYVIFLPITVLVYFLLPYKYRNCFLLIASYFFYGSWLPKYLILIIGTTLITYFVSILINKNDSIKSKKIYLALGIIINLTVLFIFKYSNFFVHNINKIFDIVNINLNFNDNFNILLPVGISFYVFQSIGYCIDVYRKDVECEKNFVTYALFISFFPQLVAGPIERSKNLLPQFYEKHKFSYAKAICGMRYILLGMFRKVVIADLLAIFVNSIYNNVYQYNGLTLIITTIMFAIQIYCDFSGYSMIAIGSAKIFGFDLMENFKSPYLSSSISEFWNRWHISLSTWFKDYIYIPLGGNRKGFKKKLINLVIIFFVSGLWHGANWTFIIWGIIHAVYRVIEELYKYCVEPLKFKYQFLYKWQKILKILMTFSFVCIAWIFFRANCFNDARYVIMHLFDSFNLNVVSADFEKIVTINFFNSKILRKTLFLIILFSISHLLMVDVAQYKYKKNISELYDKLKYYRYFEYVFLPLVIMFVFAFLNSVYGQTGQFIYFQF